FLRARASRGRIHAVFQLDADEVEAAELDRDEVAVTIDLRAGGAPVEVPPRARELFARFSTAPTESKLEYFPDNRSLDAAGVATSIGQEKRVRPTRRPNKYGGLVPSLVSLSTLDGARALEETGRAGIMFA